MEHIIFRKKIDFKVIAYILIILLSVPVMIVVFANQINYRQANRQLQTLLAQNQLREAHETLMHAFKTYGYKKDLLRHYLRYLNLQDAKDRYHHQEVIRVSIYLLEHFIWVPREVYRDMGYGYYHLGRDYYGLAEDTLGRYLQKSAEDKIEAETYKIMYDLYIKQQKYHLAEAIAITMSDVYTHNSTYKLNLAKAYLLNGKVLLAKTLLEEIVYYDSYSLVNENAAALLIELLETKLLLPQEGQHIRSYIQHKRALESSLMSHPSEVMQIFL